jgi:dynein heavy chain, axonemal
MEEKCPDLFDLREVVKKYPTKYEESMNTVLVQEVEKYNALMAVMKDHLKDVKRALSGDIGMSDVLDSIASALFNGLVPVLWKNENTGFKTLLPLPSWTEDLQGRVEFINSWITGGTPIVFWLSKFIFAAAFVTGTKQNYARQHSQAIDELTFDFFVKDEYSAEQIFQIDKKPEDGAYCYGMYLEGARWDYKTHLLSDSEPKVLFQTFPLVLIVPHAMREKPSSGIYDCPVYRTLERIGMLSTTGHSTNFVMSMELPSDRPQDNWIRAGVALFLALRY